MTKDRDLKQHVRARMLKTGESYTAARAVLVAKKDAPKPPSAAAPRAKWAELAGTRDEAIAEKTGHNWAEWVERLDDARAYEKSVHARRVGPDLEHHRRQAGHSLRVRRSECRQSRNSNKFDPLSRRGRVGGAAGSPQDFANGSLATRSTDCVMVCRGSLSRASWACASGRSCGWSKLSRAVWSRFVSRTPSMA